MLEIGSLIAGKYKILNIIGKGGMSIVYLAMNEKVNKQWAVKEVIKKDDYDFYLELQEIEMMKKLKHPHLPSIVDVIEKDESLLIVMDYIEGRSLEAVFEEYGAQSKEIIIDWGIQLCDVLDYLHSRTPPVIYRDMKPANVILRPDGRLMLIDFGTAREYKPDNLRDTISLGTRGYAAPEQYFDTGQSDERTDLYCLGMMLFQFLTGSKPMMPSEEMEEEKLATSGLLTILEKCIEPRKEDRYQSAKELSYALSHHWEYDQAYRREQKKKCKILGILTLVTMLLCCSAVSFRILEISAKEHTYEALLQKAGNSGTQKEEILNYQQAINLEPKREEGYFKLLRECFLEDEWLSVEESEWLKSILYEYGNQKETNWKAFSKNQKYYDQFSYEAGIAYFYKYEEKSNKKSAKFYFEIAADSQELNEGQKERAKRLFLISDYYYKIGVADAAGDAFVTYEDYWRDLVALMDGNLVEMDNERTAIVIYEEFLGQLIASMMGFKTAGISKEEVLEQLANVHFHLKNDFKSEMEDVKRLKDYLEQAEKLVQSAYKKEP